MTETVNEWASATELYHAGCGCTFYLPARWTAERVYEFFMNDDRPHTHRYEPPARFAYDLGETSGSAGFVNGPLVILVGLLLSTALVLLASSYGWVQ